MMLEGDFCYFNRCVVNFSNGNMVLRQDSKWKFLFFH
jgi:hypothetical protein